VAARRSTRGYIPAAPPGLQREGLDNPVTIH
jgi:hypothetical protein